MRSKYVFAAVKEINNRFLLCRLTAISARHLQTGCRQSPESINHSLQVIAAGCAHTGCKSTSANNAAMKLLPERIEHSTSTWDNPAPRSLAHEEPSRVEGLDEGMQLTGLHSRPA